MAKDYPYIIGRNELDQNRVENIWYFVDGVVMTDNWKVVKKPEELIGEQILKELPALFWEYEIDEVYVRNESTKRDYIIGSSTQTYRDSVLEDYPEMLDEDYKN